MTIDERVLFLVQSTESLHQTVQEMTAQIQQHTEQMKAMDERFDRRFDALLTVVEKLAAVAQSHEDRLDKLDGGQPR